MTNKKMKKVKKNLKLLIPHSMNWQLLSLSEAKKDILSGILKKNRDLKPCFFRNSVYRITYIDKITAYSHEKEKEKLIMKRRVKVFRILKNIKNKRVSKDVIRDEKIIRLLKEMYLKFSNVKREMKKKKQRKKRWGTRKLEKLHKRKYNNLMKSLKEEQNERQRFLPRTI